MALWLAAALVNRRGRSTLAMWLITLEVVAHALLAVAALGWASGFQYYLVPLIPFVMFNDRLASRTVAIISAGICAALLALRALAPEGAAAGALPAGQPTPGDLALRKPGDSPAGPGAGHLLLSESVDDRRAADGVDGAHRSADGPAQPALDGAASARGAQGFQRTGRAFSVVMADVDRFKRINDAHGHAAGDRVLRAVAGLFGERLRGHDAVARWGGEEFLLLLPETDLATACEVADRLRLAVEARLPEIAGLGESLTLTFGVAVFDRPMRVDACLKKADEALYAGKAEGRNRVVRAATSMSG